MATKKTAARKTIKAGEDNVVNAFEQAGSFSTAANDQIQSVFTAFSENAESLREQAEDAFSAMRGNMESAQSRFQTVSAELVAAAREEASEAVTFVNELARAKTVADALEIQRTYWTNLFETRVERTREFAKTSAEAARETFEPISKSMTSLPGFASFEKFFPFGAK